MPRRSQAPAPTEARTLGRAGTAVHAASVACFVAAALMMLSAGALHSAGRDGTSSMAATLGYALGVLGIAAGVLALTLDPDQEKP